MAKVLCTSIMKRLSRRDKWVSTNIYNVPLSQIDKELHNYIRERVKQLFNVEKLPTIRLSFFKYTRLGKVAPLHDISIATHDEEDMSVVIYDDIVKEVIPEAVKDSMINLSELYPYIVHEAMHLLQKWVGTFTISEDYYEGISEVQAYKETLKQIKYELSRTYKEPELRAKVIEVLRRKVPRAPSKYWEKIYREVISEEIK